VTGSRQAARYSTDGSVAARYDDSRLIRQKLRDALIRGKVQVCVVWKGSPQEHLHLVGHGAGPWVDQEKLAHTRRRGPNRSPKTGSSLDAESELFVLFPPRPKNARRETNTETSTLAGLPSSRNRNARLSSARELRARHPRHTPASRSTLRSIRSTSTSPTMVSQPSGGESLSRPASVRPSVRCFPCTDVQKDQLIRHDEFVCPTPGGRVLNCCPCVASPRRSAQHHDVPREHQVAAGHFGPASTRGRKALSGQRWHRTVRQGRYGGLDNRNRRRGELDRKRGDCKNGYSSSSNPPACGRWRGDHGVEHSPQLKLQQAVKFVHLY